MTFLQSVWPFRAQDEDSTLAFIAGYVDTLGFVALFGMFTAHVTGNFVLLGADLVVQSQGMLLKLLAFPAFLCGIAVGAIAVRLLPAHRLPCADSLLYLLQAILMLIFLISGYCAQPLSDPQNITVLLCGMSGAMAMGVQNAHAKLITRVGVANTVMTGNVTQIVIDALALMRPGVSDATEREKQSLRFKRTAWTLLGFAAGAVGGALLFARCGFGALMLPVLLLLCLSANAAPLRSALTPTHPDSRE